MWYVLAGHCRCLSQIAGFKVYTTSQVPHGCCCQQQHAQCCVAFFAPTLGSGPTTPMVSNRVQTHTPAPWGHGHTHPLAAHHPHMWGYHGKEALNPSYGCSSACSGQHMQQAASWAFGVLPRPLESMPFFSTTTTTTTTTAAAATTMAVNTPSQCYSRYFCC